MQAKYQAKQFVSLLENIYSRQISGILWVTANSGVGEKARAHQIVFHKGEIVYSGDRLPDNVTFVKSLSQKLDRGLIERAISFVVPKLAHKQSVRELLEMIVRLRIIQWTEIETIVSDRVVQTIEQLLPYAGEYRLEANDTFDLTHGESGRGLDWTQIKQKVEQRRQVWESFSPLIPSMYMIPQRQKNDETFARVTDTSARYHLQMQVDGKRSLVEIAEKIDQDPLILGQSYLMWAQAGWITCNPAQSLVGDPIAKSNLSGSTQSPAENRKVKRPLILSVDDSLIVQTTIKRILNDSYEVMLANNAIAALNVLKANKVDVLLLDVTMPDIDGLEFCKTLRAIPQFKKLPIIMLTAKDSMVDKCQGFIAGSNQYLYKPIEPEKLLEVIGSYIKA
jgi:CheY-like chemotaxis protein